MLWGHLLQMSPVFHLWLLICALTLRVNLGDEKEVTWADPIHRGADVVSLVFKLGNNVFHHQSYVATKENNNEESFS